MHLRICQSYKEKGEMCDQVFDSHDWYRAVTLAERLGSAVEDPSAPADPGAADGALARLAQWRSQAPFAQDGYFARRLAADGLSEDSLLTLLGEPIPALHDRLATPPAWLRELDQAFAAPASHEPWAFPETLRDSAGAGFLDVAGPLMRRGYDRVRRAAEPLAAGKARLPFDPATVGDLLLGSLYWHLVLLLQRTMALEINVARLQGSLTGDTPEARFASFCRRLSDPVTALGLLREYPVLARLLVVSVENWASVSIELLQRLSQDWDAICSTFCPDGDPGNLVAVDAGAGDSHRGGHSVHLLRFSSGFRLVYKPHSMAVDAHFQELLAWLNERGATPPFRVLRVLDRGAYGWEEFVSPAPCASTSEAQRFYQRQGANLALLYVLVATDFHYENLVAAGEYPVLLDLEALFHPSVTKPDQQRAADLASSRFICSVLIAGLLPMRVWANAASEGVDVSGLGATGGQLTPNAVPAWEGAGTDEMKLARKRVSLPEGSHRPAVDGQPVHVLDHADDLLSGFARMYRLLWENRAPLAEGPLARFAGDPTRAILRNTRTYAMLLYESYHPDVLRDGLEREHLLDRLWQAVENAPQLERVVGAERADLWAGDVPMFLARPDSRHVWTSSGEMIPDYFAESGLALARRRLQNLSEADLEQQLWFIRASLATVAPFAEERSSRQLAPSLRAPDREQFVSAARAIAGRLSALALYGPDDVLWLGLTFTDERHAQLATVGSNLYDGLAGLAMFLGYLGAVTEDEAYRSLAQAAIRTALAGAEGDPALATHVGSFCGWGGLIYALAHLGTLWGDSGLLGEALSLVDRIAPLVDQDEAYDIVSGSAGCIVSLLSLYRCLGSERVLQVAVQAGERLLAAAQPMPAGIAWRAEFAVQPLTGFSHGAAGISRALLELAAATGDERFRAAGLDAIAYERSTFLPEDGNWPDFRTPVNPSVQIAYTGPKVTWCHGAPGIGLARLRALRHANDDVLLDEIGVAAATTLRVGFGGNLSLCHGDLGNLDFLLEASRLLPDSALAPEVTRIAAQILAGIEERGWVCGVPLGVEVPGLMTGLAGIGYELLRLAEPERVPSLLALDPPLTAKGDLDRC